MAAGTGIDWTDATDNPFSWHCTKVSAGCDNCFAEKIANRWHGVGYFTDAPPALKPQRLLLPWQEEEMRAAYRHFLTSMSDPFHHRLPRSDQALVWAWMAADRVHVHQALSKRGGVMRARLNSPEFAAAARAHLDTLESMAGDARRITPWRQLMLEDIDAARRDWTWPPRNVWAGVSVENAEQARIRIPQLARTNAAVRFLSCEPLLGPLDLTTWLHAIHWVIGGGESGPGHRAPDPAWAASLRDQCVQAGVPFWWKQWGGHTPTAGGDLLDGRQWKEFPVPRPGVLV